MFPLYMMNQPPQIKPSVPPVRSPDQTLRANGFKIVSREKGREALWRRNNQVFSESRALRLCHETPAS